MGFNDRIVIRKFTIIVTCPFFTSVACPPSCVPLSRDHGGKVGGFGPESDGEIGRVRVWG